MQGSGRSHGVGGGGGVGEGGGGVVAGNMMGSLHAEGRVGDANDKRAG